MTHVRHDVARGRDLFARRRWGLAYEALAEADRAAAIDLDDLERWATAAYLFGRDIESADLWARAHRESLARDEVERAVRQAFWLAFGLMHKGERARGGAWVAKAVRLLESCSPDCVERGYLLVPEALAELGAGDAAAAYETLDRASTIGKRCGDADLVALALHSRGRVLILLDRRDEGVRLLDEAMAAVETGEVSPSVAGDVYCSVIEGCWEIFDLARAQEWTAALTHWCEAQPDLVPYRGQCLVRRAELMQLHGSWSEAAQEAERACAWLTRPPGEPAAGAAFYRRAELHRLRGETSAAERAFRDASRWGRVPQPGLALLRLAQGRPDTAATSIRHALHEARGLGERARLLPPFIEIMLAADDLPSARAAADELSMIAERLDALIVHAAATHASGAVLLMGGDAVAARARLRDAAALWQRADVPYEVARVRVLIATASRALQDEDDEALELDAARVAFRRLGADRDLASLRLRLQPGRGGYGVLTPRELQVLRRIAAGNSNRSIAATLVISEKTVARHVSNIFTKLGIANRAAATAFAYQHDLVEPPPT